MSEVSAKELERRRKISEHSKGRKAWNKGLKGSTIALTEEGRRRKSEACRKQWLGKPKTEAQKAKMSVSLKGHPSLVGRPSNEGSFKSGHQTWNRLKSHPDVLGEKNPNYKHGKYAADPYNRERKSARWKDWELTVKQRDGFECVQCGSDDQLIAHHILGSKEFPEKRYEVLNGETLCNECHTSLHTLARSTNSKDQT